MLIHLNLFFVMWNYNWNPNIKPQHVEEYKLIIIWNVPCNKWKIFVGVIWLVIVDCWPCDHWPTMCPNIIHWNHSMCQSSFLPHHCVIGPFIATCLAPRVKITMAYAMSPSRSHGFKLQILQSKCDIWQINVCLTCHLFSLNRA
jgi:hypothetical protein